MTTPKAEKLIDDLGLSEYTSTARISFFYQSVPKSFLVVYDSLNTRRIITKQVIKNYANICIKRDGNRQLDFSPPIDLIKFNGNTDGIFVTYDIGPAMKVWGRTPYNESKNNNLEIDYSKIKVFRLNENGDIK